MSSGMDSGHWPRRGPPPWSGPTGPSHARSGPTHHFTPTPTEGTPRPCRPARCTEGMSLQGPAGPPPPQRTWIWAPICEQTGSSPRARGGGYNQRKRQRRGLAGAAGWLEATDDSGEGEERVGVAGGGRNPSPPSHPPKRGRRGVRSVFFVRTYSPLHFYKTF